MMRPTSRIRRWALAGTTLGATAVFGTGCHTVEPPPDPYARPFTALYPGLGEKGLPASGLAYRGPAKPTSPAEPPDGVRQAQATAPAVPDAPPAAPVSTLDLGAALGLAGVDNPTINLARERVREAAAAHLAARSMLLPDVNVGGNFSLHRGVLQTTPGQIRDVDRQNLYLGFGARAVGSSTVAVPGVWLFAHLGDAVYEPRAARQQVAVRRSDAQAVQNAILLDVAAAYLTLAGAEARLAVLHQGQTDVAEVVRQTRVYAEKGQGRAADANRAEANAELLRREVRRAEEDVAVAAAQLCRLLNLDPAARVRTPGGVVEPLRLVAEDADPEALVAEAVRARPEPAARAAGIGEAQTRVRQEEVRPWVPTLSAGYSGGLFGGGGNGAATDFGPLNGRSDFDVLAVWNVQNLGFGNRARVRGADAVVGQAVAGYEAAVNRVRREVAEAQAEARAAATQIETAKAAVAAAEEGFALEEARIRQGQGLPIETLDSFRQLLDARQELIRAVVAFDVAQFRLFTAVGNTPATPAATTGK